MSVPNPFEAEVFQQRVIGVPISSLGLAQLPLDGTEQIPLVQNGVTKQVPSSVFSGGGSIVTILELTGIVTPPQLPNSTTDDWSPDLTDISRVQLTTAGNSAVVSGMIPADDGRVVILTNVGANELEIQSEGAGSTPEFRFAMNGNALLYPGWSIVVMYVDAIQRWTRLS